MSIPYIGIELYNLNIFTASNVSEKLVRKEYCVVTCKKERVSLGDVWPSLYTIVARKTKIRVGVQ